MKVKISAYAFDEELMKTNGESLQVPLYASLAPHKTGWNVIDFPLQYIITSRRIVCACSSAPHAPCWNTFPYYQHTRSIFHWSSYCNSPPVALASFSALKHRKGFKGRLSILDVFFECSPGGCVCVSTFECFAYLPRVLLHLVNCMLELFFVCFYSIQIIPACLHHLGDFNFGLVQMAYFIFQCIAHVDCLFKVIL